MASAHDAKNRPGGIAAWAFLLLSLLWLLLLALAPLSVSRRATPSWSVAVMTYAVGARVCHQRPDRSFHIGAIQLPVCTRCAGLYAGAPIGALLALARRRSAGARIARSCRGSERAMLALFALPTILTVGIELAGVPVTGVVRAAAGALFSAGGSRLLIGALVGEPHIGEVN